MMFKQRIHRIPAAVLVVLLAILAWRAWTDVGDEPLTVGQRNPGIESVSWAGTVRSDGRLAVNVHYVFDDDATRTFRAYLPDGAQYVMVNGSPVSMSSDIVDEISVSREVLLSYELDGAVTRYRDGAVLRLLGVSSSSVNGAEGLFSCPRCYIGDTGYGDTPVFGSLFVPNAPTVRFHLVGLSSVRPTTTGGDSARFAGIDEGTTDVSMVATFGAEAVPQLPTRDGTVSDALEGVRAELKGAGERLVAPREPPHGERWAAIAITVMVGLLVLLLVQQIVLPMLSKAFGRAARDAAADPLQGHLPFADTRSIRPTDLEPALAGFIVGDVVRGDRSSVGATLTELARKHIIEIDGADLRRFTVRVPAGATGTTPFEQAVIDVFRDGTPADRAAERTTPHLWGERPQMAIARLGAAVVRAARREDLMRVNYAARAMLPLTIASAVVAIVGTTIVAYPWVVLFLGAALAVAASFSAGVTLTARGQAERERWIEYSQYLKSNEHLAAAAPWTVANYGQLMSYAIALGAAPEAARALSPERGKKI